MKTKDKEDFLYWNNFLEIENYTSLRSFLKITDSELKFLINDTGRDIIQLFDGKHTYSEIVKYLCKKYNDSRKNVDEVIENFLLTLKMIMELNYCIQTFLFYIN